MVKAYIEPGEVKQLEDAAMYLRDKLLIRLLFRLGCRISEALGIATSDIDFAHGAVTIQHLKLRLKLSCPDCGTNLSKTARFCPGCGGKVEKAVSEEKEHHRQRSLPLDAATMAMIREYIDRGGPVGTSGKPLLFGMSRNHAWKIVSEGARRAGLGYLVNPDTGKPRGISPHRLRDAFAINAMKQDDSGDELRLLQEMLGHQSFNTTAKYRKVAGEELRSWYEKLWKEQGGKADGQ